jgi:hypothetical protein
LPPGNQVAFNHDADDALLTMCDLICHSLAHLNLILMLFATIGVAAIDHDARW